MYSNELARGRSWYTADTAQMVDFGDCVRSEIFWDDGAYAYELHDTKEEAIATLARLGFSPNEQ